MDSDNIEISLIRLSSSPGSIAADRFNYLYQSVPPGHGYLITTYMGDGNPPPAFEGEPKTVPLGGTIEEIGNEFWSLLNEDNRISLAVKFIDIATGITVSTFIKNKYAKVA